MRVEEKIAIFVEVRTETGERIEQCYLSDLSYKKVSQLKRDTESLLADLNAITKPYESKADLLGETQMIFKCVGCGVMVERKNAYLDCGQGRCADCGNWDFNDSFND